MRAVNPYLNFPGTSEEAFNFYRSVFGGEFTMIMRFSDTGEGDKLPEEDKSKIMHISLPLSNGTILMATDCLASMGQKHIPGNNNYLCVNTDSREEADKLFNGLSAGGKIEMPMADMFWGDYFGSFVDKYDINWMISFNTTQQ